MPESVGDFSVHDGRDRVFVDHLIQLVNLRELALLLGILDLAGLLVECVLL